MKIATAQLEMQSTHRATEHRQVSERLRVWSGEPPPPSAAEVSLSAPGRQRSAEAAAIDAAQDAVDTDPMLALLKAMLFRLFGVEIEVFDARELKAPEPADLPADLRPAGGTAPAGFGVEYDYHASRTETEELRFAAEGVVQTADGQTIRFAVSFEMARSYTERIDIALRLGDAARKKDPLVINFAGPAAQLADRTFRIDLDGDGAAEEAHFVAPGTGFLVFDRNADGRIDRADELFGPRTGDGFAELAQLDADGNGWIDEADADYAKLQVWTKDAGGADRLQSLQAAGVGAISLARLATPFSIKDTDNALRGEVKSSGVYLAEDGTAGTVQQIDLAV